MLVTGIVSVATRGPLAETDARPAADPNAPDPIAAALGAEQLTRHGPETEPPPGPPSASALGAVDEVEAEAVATRGTGPSDTTDRD